MTELVHFLGLDWADDRPALRYRPDPACSTSDAKEIAAGRPLALAVHGPRRCVGYYDFVEKVRYPCPQARHLAPQYQQCFRCQRREVTYYTFTGYAADPDAAQAYLEAHTHQAYLALFGRELVKVGVAVVGRKYRRTLEQGAQACLFVAEANGAEIRELERYVARALGVKDKITVLQKVKRLLDLASPSGAFSTLWEAAQHLGAHLPADLQVHILPQPEYHYLQETYQLQVDPSVMELQLLKAPMAGETYRGVVRGVVGQLLVLGASDQQLYIVPMNRLVGYLLTIGEGIGRMELQQQPQSVRLSREP